MSVDFRILVEIARSAGQLLRAAYKEEYDLAYKEDCSPVTSADIASQRRIIEGLKARYPDIPIVAEEEGRVINPSWDTYFIVDPLDGTKEFVAKTDEFSVLIGYVKACKVEVGVIYAPIVNRCFYACRGKGAFEIIGDSEKRLQVSDKKQDATALVSRFNKGERFLEALSTQSGISRIKECGSAIKGCLVAAGEAELYLRWGNTYKWDTAAMDLIVEEAGGEALQLDGTKIDYSLNQLLNDKGLVFSNRHFGFKSLTEVCKHGYDTHLHRER